MIKNISKDLQLIKSIHSTINIRHLILPSHIILSLFYIHNNDSASRYTIADFLGIPLTRARKILSILEENGLILKNKGRKGSILTSRGENLCQELFTYIKLLNPFESWDLGTLVLGTINCLVAIPMDIDKRTINVVKIRDTSMKTGAIGSSIFEAKYDRKNDKFIILFLNEDQNDSISDPLGSTESFQFLGLKLDMLKGTETNWILIASTINELPRYYFNPLFKANLESALKVVLVSAVQSLWEMIEDKF